MTTTAVNGGVSNNLQPLPQTPPYADPGRVALTVNALGEGRTNAFGTITLAANADATKVVDPNFNGMQYVLLIPLTANAAAALATTYQDATQSLQGSFVIVHANNAQTDRNFVYVRFG